MIEETVGATETEETQEEAVPTKSQDKKYSDDEVNRIVAKEKAAWKKSVDREKEALSAVEGNLRGDLSFYEEKLAAIIATQISDFDPVTLDLFKALPIREQLEKLSNEEFVAKIRRKTVLPETPKENSNSSQSPFKRKTTI